MTEYDKMSSVMRDLRELAKKHNIAFITATQVKRSSGPTNPNRQHSDVVLVDYLDRLV